jgi:glutaconate CoA-transferase, subunit B
MSDDYKPVLRPGSDPLVFFKGPGENVGGDIAKGHVMAAAISHELRDGEVVVMGANSLIPMAGSRLAQLTHAPNLTIIAGASGGVNPLVEPLTPSSGDYANLVAEAMLSFSEVLTLQMGGHTDVFFVGGLQIDRRGNCNLNYTGPSERPTLRGPGAAGLPVAPNSRRTIIYTTRHDSRVFVPRVDFISYPGWRHGRPSGGSGPSVVVTPLAVLDFTDAGEMRVKSLHAGISVEEVRDNTGFDLALPEGAIPETIPPTSDELVLMRTFDPDGLLAIVV